MRDREEQSSPGYYLPEAEIAAGSATTMGALMLLTEIHGTLVELGKSLPEAVSTLLKTADQAGVLTESTTIIVALIPSLAIVHGIREKIRRDNT